MQKNKPNAILIHCTDVSYRAIPDQFHPCNGWHKDRTFPMSSLGFYIGYHRIITGDRNYQARLDTDEGAHCNQKENGVSMNFQSLGVCIGFDGDIEMPTTMQYALLQKQVWEWQDQYGIPNERVKFHRDYATDKSCPGSLITKQWLKDLLTRPIPITVPAKPPESMCIAQEKIIAEQKVKISALEAFINSIRSLFSNIK